MKMKTIIPPVDRTLLKKELNSDRFVRNTNYGNNEIYYVTFENAPNVLREIGRLREITFRDAGGGTGKACDLDEYDKGENAFQQLIVWDPEEEEIIGGYRFIHCKKLEITKEGEVLTPTADLFAYSEDFVKNYLPFTIELGRSFVQPTYQPTNNIRKGMFALDNIWDGLGAIVIDHPDIRYLFGKVTMYPHYDRLARDFILFFLNKHFPDHEKLVVPYKPVTYHTDTKVLNNIFSGYNYEEDYKILVQNVRKLKQNIPPLFNAYMNLSGTMRTFGTALNEHFGMVEETGIIVTIDDIYDYKKERHLSTYAKDNPGG